MEHNKDETNYKELIHKANYWIRGIRNQNTFECDIRYTGDRSPIGISNNMKRKNSCKEKNKHMS